MRDDRPDHRHTVDDELRDSLAIHYAFEALSDVDSETTVLEHCERLSMLMFDTAHRFFDAAQAERARPFFENAVTKGRNIPDDAKAALLQLHELYDLKQFDTYGRAGIIIGIAAGLRGMGRQHLTPPEPDEKGGA